MTKFMMIQKFLNEKSIVTTAEAQRLNISATAMKNWADQGKLERVARGIYSLPGEVVDSLYVMQLRCSKGVYSHETALYLHDLTDRIPSRNVMTVAQGYNVHRFSDATIDFHWVQKEYLELGLIEVKSMYGNTIRTYDLERTICDIVRNKENMDLSIYNQAIREYVYSSMAKKFKLSLYAQKMGISQRVNKVMEVFG